MIPNIAQIVWLLWAGVFVLWFLSSRAVKRSLQAGSRAKANATNAIVWVGWWVMMYPRWSGVLGLRFAPLHVAVQIPGLLIVISGLGLAVWARFYLGRNWSAVIELRKDHELMRGGPYAIVRHPIYSGFMIATLGTAVVNGQVAGLAALGLVVCAWAYKAALEERFLLVHFGSAYQQYQREVKRLVPFMW
jgi:protein-S-isoprenylcysteine O-methyltransferase Ste14